MRLLFVTLCTVWILCLLLFVVVADDVFFFVFSLCFLCVFFVSCSHLVAGGKLYVKGGRSTEDIGIFDMECYDPNTDTWEVVLRVDRGNLPKLQGKGGKQAMDANIVDALIADFEHEDFIGNQQVLGLSGDAQRCMHLAGML